MVMAGDRGHVPGINFFNQTFSVEHKNDLGH